jgi:hypothetical protein
MAGVRQFSTIAVHQPVPEEADILQIPTRLGSLQCLYPPMRRD